MAGTETGPTLPLKGMKRLFNSEKSAVEEENRQALLRNSNKRIRFLQHLDHRLGCNDLRVISHRVDLTKFMKSTGHLFYAGQPYQGVFANTVSVNVKDNLLDRRGQCDGRGQDQKKGCDHCGLNGRLIHFSDSSGYG